MDKILATYYAAALIMTHVVLLIVFNVALISGLYWVLAKLF
jgi:hypothetical protein